jgi:CheY-like chemotaxis protein
MDQVGKVLIIDDDQDLRAALRSVLEAHGYVVFEAGCGREGLRALSEQQPDVILLDVMLECCNEGYGINQTIKFRDEYEPFRKVPIVMMSSIEASPDERFPMASEVDMIRPDWYLTKPLDIARLLAVLESAIAVRTA